MQPYINALSVLKFPPGQAALIDLPALPASGHNNQAADEKNNEPTGYAVELKSDCPHTEEHVDQNIDPAILEELSGLFFF